jgi:hypothetical protein
MLTPEQKAQLVAEYQAESLAVLEAKLEAASEFGAQNASGGLYTQAQVDQMVLDGKMQVKTAIKDAFLGLDSAQDAQVIAMIDAQ